MKIEIEIDDDIFADVERFLARQDPESGANTHGHLDVAGLVQMLLEDVVLTERRPGSWEGEKMDALLASHGYEA